MEMKDEIDDEEVSLEEFIDSKMEGWQMEEVERMYDLASQCLCEKKNKRPPITQVCVCVLMCFHEQFNHLLDICISLIRELVIEMCIYLVLF